MGDVIPTIDITIDDRDIKARLEKLDDKGKEILFEAVDERAEFIYKFWRRYTRTGRPPQPAGSEYIRTFNLKRSVYRQPTQKTQDGAKADIVMRGSIANYNVYVKNPLTANPPQARIHWGRWSRVDKDAEDARKFLINAIEKLVARKFKLED